MGEFKINVSANMIGTKMTCLNCNHTMYSGNKEDFKDSLAVDLTMSRSDDTIVFSDVVCSDCGCNTFQDIIGYLAIEVN